MNGWLNPPQKLNDRFLMANILYLGVSKADISTVTEKTQM